MKSKLLIFIFILGSIIISCEKDKGPVIIKPDIPEPPVDSSIHYISYKDYIQPLFNDYCIGCHNPNHPFINLQGASSYNELLFTGANAPYVISLDPDNSQLIQRLVGDEFPIMPPDPPHVSQADIDSVRLWITQGYKDN